MDQYVQLYIKLYYPTNIEYEKLSTTEVLQLSVKHPGKSEFGHPQTWMPPESALRQLGKQDRTIIFNLGPECHTSNKNDLLTVPDEVIGKKLKEYAMPLKRKAVKKISKDTPQKEKLPRDNLRCRHQGVISSAKEGFAPIDLTKLGVISSAEEEYAHVDLTKLGEISSAKEGYGPVELTKLGVISSAEEGYAPVDLTKLGEISSTKEGYAPVELIKLGVISSAEKGYAPVDLTKLGVTSSAEEGYAPVDLTKLGVILSADERYAPVELKLGVISSATEEKHLST
ncbi:unnamed protein product [Mytilus coruscus]|uniref:Uncharacterized protein n=1 Tax=Mytilus coruscus TaxID=42192 RepID=A0A6J8E5B8_MYTCO|nr:unnamed protein product [Mytilus coruscus]